jgi:hypothetical protein
MTPDTIERLAAEAGLPYPIKIMPDVMHGNDSASAAALEAASNFAFEKFAALIRAEALEEAALFCDAYAKVAEGFTEEEHAAQCLAEEIRALKQP